MTFPAGLYVIPDADGNIMSVASYGTAEAAQHAALTEPWMLLWQLPEPPDPLRHYAAGGQVFTYSPLQAAIKAASWPPRPGLSWSNATMAWVDNRSLQQAKDEQKAAVMRAREQAKAAGISYQGNTYPTTLEGRQQILELGLSALRAVTLNLPFSAALVNVQGVAVPMNATQALAIHETLVSHVQAQEAQAAALFAAIDAAGSLPEVGGIVWPPAS